MTGAITADPGWKARGKAKPTRIDIPVQAGAGGIMATRIYAPDPKATAELPGPIWVVMAPGATAAWYYWDLEPEGEEEEFSAAKMLLARGIGVALVDTYGIRDSAYRGHGSELDTETLALALHQAASEIRRRLKAGTLLPGVTAVDPLLVGIGHSGGAGLTVFAQGTHATYDMIIDFGLPVSPFGGYGGGPDAIRAAATLDEKGYYHLGLRPGDDPLAAAAAAEKDVPPASRPLLHLLPLFTGNGMPPGMPQLMQPGMLVEAASKITVPVLTVFGEIDLPRNPLDEIKYYTATDDMTLHVQVGTGHMQVLSPYRHELYELAFSWIYGRAKYRFFAR